MAIYTKDELDKILNKEVEIVLGDMDDDNFSFKGKVISYILDSENSDSLKSFVFHTEHGAIKQFDFTLLIEIREL